jgi:hypothetical protein
MIPLSDLVDLDTDSGVEQSQQIADSVLDAVQRFADASRNMAFSSWAAQETALALKEADATAHNVHNDALEAHLLEQQNGGGDQPMGFTSAPDPKLAENMSTAAMAAEESKLMYGRAEAAAKMAEVSAERAAWELEQAQSNLLDIARSVPPAETDESDCHLNVGGLV